MIILGNHISLETACHLAMKLTDKESHVPVPTRLAELETHIERENEKSKLRVRKFTDLTWYDDGAINDEMNKCL